MWQISIKIKMVYQATAHTGFYEGPDFVPNVLRRTFEILKDGQEIDVLTAVVDRIPFPRCTRPADRTAYQASSEDALPAKRIEDGSEGVSFAVLDSNFAAPDLWSSRAESKELETMTIQQRCTLSFAFPPTVIPIPIFPDGKKTTQPLVSRVLQLPVANTLFQNGKTSTLIAQRWRSQRSTDTSFALSCSREAKLPQQILHMTDVFSDQSTGLDQSLHSHLMPITPTRTVTAAIGNIIRRISVDDTSEEGVPASEELERAISTAIRDGRIPAKPAGIWALVRPQNYTSPGQAGVGLGGTVDHKIQQAVFSGCQLHKVLSGGGGWGEKQGLLALDPDSDYRMSQQAFKPSYLEDQDVKSEKLQAFGELVNPGDTVEFYVYKSPPIPDSTRASTPKFDPTDNPTSVSLRFGSLPSNMDAMPNAPSDEIDLSSRPSCMVFKHHFGMLSEQGMSLESTFLETNLRASKVRYFVPKSPRRFLPSFEVLDKFVLTTKLDAPYTTWSIEAEFQAVDLSSGMDWRKAQSPSGNARIFTPQKRTKTGSNAITSTMAQFHKAKWETLDGFVEAVSTMPSHQHVATVDPHPRDLRRVERKAGGKTPSEALAIGREAAELRGRPVRQLIRKFETAGLEIGAASVPLMKFSQVQSHIHDWVNRSGEKEDAREQPRHRDTNAIPRDNEDIARTSQQLPDDIMSVTSEKIGARGRLQPKRQVHGGVRIRKMVAKLPSVMNQRLASSVRRTVILGPLPPKEALKVAKEIIAASDSEDSVRRRVLGSSGAWNEQQSAKKDEPEIETEASRVPKRLQEPLPVSQSGFETESLEQLKTPSSEPELKTALMKQPMCPEHMRRHSSKIIRKVAGLKEPPSVVRKYLGLVSQRERQIDQKALHNFEMAARRKEGLFQKKARGMPKPKEGLIQMAPTWYNQLHPEYHLPLLDECPDDAPRP